MSRSRREEVRIVERSRIVLACLEGKQIKEVARELGTSVLTVSKWRRRFAACGVDACGIGPVRESRRPTARTFEVGFCPCWKSRRRRVWGSGTAAQWQIVWAQACMPFGVCYDGKESICSDSGTWCVSTDPEFATKAAEIVGLYLNPPLNALTLSVDEKPSIQAIQRPSGYVETDSGAIVRAMKSTYKRNGTLNLFAALEIASGQIHAQTTEHKKREDFRRFLEGVVAELPADKEVHVILDNYCTHKRNEDWLAKFEGRVQFHFTPTSASWLNQVEIWFGLLTRKSLRGASFASKDQLRDAIQAFVALTNEHPKLFRWRKREVKGSQLRNTIVNLCN